ncbi:hypothetical protein [Chitinophaga japonensis]|uniref:Uncharacterized protein n=1 Tax=Chitinophaga japonensis TaxID=104662 RepID=A0A562SZ52_CHIJA|nr:hypothetical protein [Chitinophaga japonensis]TWI86338.1 hypothetical protein LX66_3592 [Chitinophaga japonensis]
MKYTEHDIETEITHYNDAGLMIMYGDVPADIGHVLFLNRDELVRALYDLGYATDYDVELIRIPMPALSDDEGIYNWVTLDDFIHNNSDSHGTLDWRIATDLVLNYKNNTSQTQTSLI